MSSPASSGAMQSVKTDTTPSPVIVRLSGGGTPRLRLVAAHHAGGAASNFRTWSAWCPGWVEILSIQPPGREGRIREPFATSVEQLADEATAALLAEVGEDPWVAFGHSLGGYVAFEIARRMEAAGKGPVQIVLAGCGAPSGRNTAPSQDDGVLKEELRRYGATPDAILDHPQNLAYFLPRIRADLKIAAAYGAAPLNPIETPITCIVGADDEMVSPASAALWSAFTKTEFQMVTLPGDHFFLQQPESGFRAVLLDYLTDASSFPIRLNQG